MLSLGSRTLAISLVSGLMLLAPSVARAKPGCSKLAVEKSVGSFIRAFNAGEAAAAARRWAPEPAFEWYSADGPGQRLNAAARDRGSLAGYFQDRITHREQVRRIVFKVNLDPRRGHGGFYGVLRRRADDLTPTIYTYKGVVDCSSGRPWLIVWSMAWRDRPL